MKCNEAEREKERESSLEKNLERQTEEEMYCQGFDIINTSFVYQLPDGSIFFQIHRSYSHLSARVLPS